MVKASKFLFGGLAVLFFRTAADRINATTAGRKRGGFALFCRVKNLELLLIQSYSLPRIVMALLSSGLLGLASLLLQQVMANPLASDNTLGISSGAQFALFFNGDFFYRIGWNTAQVRSH
ncbi:iron chelate uptake ABC transporter family permease subunit [Actinobacillus pleuropneumoniae]|uniref:iron chelate uptake ABC transporter family permease subunit n=1 Tax=Actinobacillus pleuropneumoniae TaxID=715 RepID=UPI0024C19638|nr:iron chelate uptake ABC transporter family permease subunit [Actinobacillus pleuropneumoniae]